MVRSAASKVMWVGRATVFLVGLAVILALVVGLASTALAHTKVDKKLFHLGHNNPVSAASTLAGNLAGKVLQVTNSGTANGSAAIQANNKSPVSPAVRAINSGGGPALGLSVGSGKAPLTVNASAGKATNLNADKLDNKDSTEFADAAHAHDGRYYSKTESDGRYLGKTEKAADSAKLDGKNSSQFLGSNVVVRTSAVIILATSWGQGRATCQTGELALSGGAFMDGNATGDAIMDIHPLDSGNNRAVAGDTPAGWDAWVYNAHNQNRTLTTYAICAALP